MHCILFAHSCRLHMRACTTSLAVLHLVTRWLGCVNGSVLLRSHVLHSKTEPLVNEVELLRANPNYAHVRCADGHETTVLIRHLSSAEGTVIEVGKSSGKATNQHTAGTDGGCPEITSDFQDVRGPCGHNQHLAPVDDPLVRHSGPVSKLPKRLNL